MNSSYLEFFELLIISVATATPICFILSYVVARRMKDDSRKGNS